MSRLIEVKVTANAKARACSVGPDGLWRVRTTKPRDGGKANEDVIAQLAESLGVAKSLLTIVSGATASRKRVRIG